MIMMLETNGSKDLILLNILKNIIGKKKLIFLTFQKYYHRTRQTAKSFQVDYTTKCKINIH